nr:HD domain-containing phosphohydrolase [uncultured Desulfobulbus sp.]
MTERILFVDDEPNVLQSIKRQLRKRFDLVTAEGGQEALRVLQENGPFAVIVSDMRMPGMNGVELLSQAKNLYPETVRLMLTGNADQETAMAAVNNGQIFRFLTKPCPQATFVTSLALALRQYRLIVAERELLQKTLKGSVNVLTELLGVANPLAFSSGLRIKNYMLHVAQTMELGGIWQFEIAAMLSQIGCITIPGDVLSKVFSGHPLTQDEEEMYHGHPQAGAALLEKIPRLENVTKMIQYQQKPFNEYDEQLKSEEFEEVLIGAQILKAVVEFDQCIFRGLSPRETREWMRKQKNAYNPEVLDVLNELNIEDQQQILSLSIKQITEGMIAAEDIVAQNGVLIIPKGQTITKIMRQGLKNFSTQVGVVEPIRIQIGTGKSEDD